MSQCVFTRLRSMLAGTILCENKDTKEIGPLGGNRRGRGRLPWNTGIRKFPALMTKAKWKRKQLKEIQSPKQVEKAGNAMFLARRNIFHFTSPTTHFKCKILSKKRGSSDSKAKGSLLFPSLLQLTLAGGIPKSPELEHYIIQQNIHFYPMCFPRSIQNSTVTRCFRDGNLFAQFLFIQDPRLAEMSLQELPLQRQ